MLEQEGATRRFGLADEFGAALRYHMDILVELVVSICKHTVVASRGRSRRRDNTALDQVSIAHCV